MTDIAMGWRVACPRRPRGLPPIQLSERLPASQPSKLPPHPPGLRQAGAGGSTRRSMTAWFAFWHRGSADV